MTDRRRLATAKVYDVPHNAVDPNWAGYNTVQVVRLADFEAAIRRVTLLEAALRSLLGSEPEKYGYGAAARVLDDETRNAAFKVLEGTL